MKEFKTAVEEAVTEADGTPVKEQGIEFKLDDRVMTAYQPTEGQLTFMLAALGRGQSSESRFASIINIMMESLKSEDRDYLESRLLTRDPKQRLSVQSIEEIFEYLMEEWFGRPTQSPSGSAE
jgi:hypothetical protein